jgi:hypothetical protein
MVDLDLTSVIRVAATLDLDTIQSWHKRIDHCGACGEEHEPQEEDRCPSCGTIGCLVSTWGWLQAERYRTGERYDETSLSGQMDVSGGSVAELGAMLRLIERRDARRRKEAP